MKWFKHDSTASLDAKLQRLRLKYGMEGYGLYWFCLESIARNVEKHNLTFELEEDAELIAASVGMHREKVEEMMVYMVDLKLFQSSEGRITCLKMAERTDEYTQKLIKSQNIENKRKKQCPDNVPTMSYLIEEKRIEENRIDKKKTVSKNKFSDDDLKCAQWMYDKLKERNPNHKKPNLETWARDISLMIRIDDRSHRDICTLFAWALDDPFWQANILSPKKLREKFDQLVINAYKSNKAARKSGSNDFIGKHTDCSWAQGLQ